MLRHFSVNTVATPVLDLHQLKKSRHAECEAGSHTYNGVNRRWCALPMPGASAVMATGTAGRTRRRGHCWFLICISSRNQGMLSVKPGLTPTMASPGAGAHFQWLARLR